LLDFDRLVSGSERLQNFIQIEQNLGP